MADAKLKADVAFEMFTAFSTQEQRLRPAAVALLRVGHGIQGPELPMEGLKVEGEQGRQRTAVTKTSLMPQAPHNHEFHQSGPWRFLVIPK